MALILSIETATTVCSVALHAGGTLLATGEVHIDQSSASRLAVLIEDVLKAADKKAAMLQAVAVSSGPGSYTGLRIGTSTAKGLCYALNIPLVAIGTLELLAAQMKDINFSGAYLCPMIDARRMEVYCLLADADLNVVRPVEAKVIDAGSFGDELAQHEIIFFGNGASKCKDVIVHANARFADNIYPKASYLGILAYQRWEQREFEDLQLFEPFYLKDFVAKKARSLL